MDTSEKEISKKTFNKENYNSIEEKNQFENIKIEKNKEIEYMLKTESTNYNSKTGRKKEISSELNPDNSHILKINKKYEFFHNFKIIKNIKDEYKKDKKKKKPLSIKTNELKN
jgi:hypothetical protein